MPDDVYGEPPNPEAIAALVAVLGMAIDRYVKNRARRTIVENAKADPAKPKCRWVVEADACEFCKKRGDFLFDPSEAPVESHSSCKCHPVADFSKSAGVIAKAPLAKGRGKGLQRSMKMRSGRRFNNGLRRSYQDRASDAPVRPSASQFLEAHDMTTLKKAVEEKYGVSLIGVDALHFESVRDFCAGIDDVLSDYPKAQSWLSLKAEKLAANTFSEVSSSGRVYINDRLFASLLEDAVSAGRHEGGHLLEVALCLNGDGDADKDYKSARHSKRLLNNALRKLNKGKNNKTKLTQEIESVSTYPARVASEYNIKKGKIKSDEGTAIFHAESLAVIVETAYNNMQFNTQFVKLVLAELNKELS